MILPVIPLSKDKVDILKYEVRSTRCIAVLEQKDPNRPMHIGHIERSGENYRWFFLTYNREFSADMLYEIARKITGLNEIIST